MANLDEQLWQAGKGVDWAQAAVLLEAGAGTEWRGGEFEDTAIMWAAIGGSLATVKRDRVSINSTKSAKFHARLCTCSHFVACWR